MAVPGSFIFSVLLLLVTFIGSASSLWSNYYYSSCPQALSIIKAGVQEAVMNEARMGASLLRLHFHDCFVNGCDGSILLDEGEGTFTSEKLAPPNNNSVRGFEVIDSIKAQLETVCPGIVSCADILAVAARDSVVELGGPSWGVPLGRKDATTASQALATQRLPSPDSSLGELIGNFSVQGLSEYDMIVLSGPWRQGEWGAFGSRWDGGHTIGKARCLTFSQALYQDTDIDPSYAASLKGNCPNSNTDSTLFPIDVQTENVFDNEYYKNLIQKKGLFHSDRVLYSGGSADSTVACFVNSQNKFFKEFGFSMIKMGRIQPAAGTKLEVRRNCKKPNSMVC